jgi:phosphate transport system substrate-binding protein
MRRKMRIGVVMAIAMIGSMNSLVWSTTSQPVPEPVQLTAAGSGVNLGITRILAEAFMKSRPQVTISVPGSIGTKGAIKASADGAITLGLISRPLQKEELDLGLTAMRYGRVPIVVATHPGVKDEGVTFQELIEIYRGAKTRWKDGNAIIVQAREKSDSGFLVLQNRIPGFKEVYLESQQANRWVIYYTDQEANEAIAKTPHAISVSDLGMIKSERLNIKALKLNGVVPNPANVQNGSYPLDRELSFIYREKDLPKEARGFLDFVRSDKGQKILKTHGYLPLN